jgi:gliding motility-associated-like protein
MTTLRIKTRPLLKDCVPNIITPHQDGQNDKLEIRFVELFSPISLKIYNRWGKLLESTEDYKQNFGADD